jgi:hypothetical protein
MVDDVQRLYSDLAYWWPLFSPPIYYVEEAADLPPLLEDGRDNSPPDVAGARIRRGQPGVPLEGTIFRDPPIVRSRCWQSAGR